MGNKLVGLKKCISLKRKVKINKKRYIFTKFSKYTIVDVKSINTSLNNSKYLYNTEVEYTKKYRGSVDCGSTLLSILGTYMILDNNILFHIFNNFNIINSIRNNGIFVIRLNTYGIFNIELQTSVKLVEIINDKNYFNTLKKLNDYYWYLKAVLLDIDEHLFNSRYPIFYENSKIIKNYKRKHFQFLKPKYILLPNMVIVPIDLRSMKDHFSIWLKIDTKHKFYNFELTYYELDDTNFSNCPTPWIKLNTIFVGLKNDINNLDYIKHHSLYDLEKDMFLRMMHINKYIEYSHLKDVSLHPRYDYNPADRYQDYLVALRLRMDEIIISLAPRYKVLEYHVYDAYIDTWIGCVRYFRPRMRKDRAIAWYISIGNIYAYEDDHDDDVSDNYESIYYDLANDSYMLHMIEVSEIYYKPILRWYLKNKNTYGKNKNNIYSRSGFSIGTGLFKVTTIRNISKLFKSIRNKHYTKMLHKYVGDSNIRNSTLGQIANYYKKINKIDIIDINDNIFADINYSDLLISMDVRLRNYNNVYNLNYSLLENNRDSPDIRSHVYDIKHVTWEYMTDEWKEEDFWINWHVSLYNIIQDIQGRKRLTTHTDFGRSFSITYRLEVGYWYDALTNSFINEWDAVRVVTYQYDYAQTKLPVDMDFYSWSDNLHYVTRDQYYGLYGIIAYSYTENDVVSMIIYHIVRNYDINRMFIMSSLVVWWLLNDRNVQYNGKYLDYLGLRRDDKYNIILIELYANLNNVSYVNRDKILCDDLMIEYLFRDQSYKKSYWNIKRKNERVNWRKNAKKIVKVRKSRKRAGVYGNIFMVMRHNMYMWQTIGEWEHIIEYIRRIKDLEQYENKDYRLSFYQESLEKRYRLKIMDTKEAIFAEIEKLKKPYHKPGWHVGREVWCMRRAELMGNKFNMHKDDIRLFFEQEEFWYYYKRHEDPTDSSNNRYRLVRYRHAIHYMTEKRVNYFTYWYEYNNILLLNLLYPVLYLVVAITLAGLAINSIKVRNSKIIMVALLKYRYTLRRYGPFLKKDKIVLKKYILSIKDFLVSFGDNSTRFYISLSWMRGRTGFVIHPELTVIEDLDDVRFITFFDDNWFLWVWQSDMIGLYDRYGRRKVRKSSYLPSLKIQPTYNILSRKHVDSKLYNIFGHSNNIYRLKTLGGKSYNNKLRPIKKR